MNALESAIRAAGEAGRKALIPFLPAGFPDKDRFWDELKALDDGGADVIEIGVPFSDPVADGPVIEEASQACLECGVTLEWLLEELMKRKGDISAPLVLMGYYNPFYKYGLDRLAADADLAGVSGFIVPDLPFEEAAVMRAALGTECIALIPLVGLNTGANRLAMYAKDAAGFAYFVSVLGITGERDSLPAEVLDKLAAASKVFSVPLAIGFGISQPSQVAAFGDNIDAVVFGSALVKAIKAGGTAAEFMERWR